MNLTISEIKETATGTTSVVKMAEALSQRALLAGDGELRECAFKLGNKAERLAVLAERVEEVGKRTTCRLSTVEWHDNNKFNILYCGVNSLGELQGLAGDFEIACARYTDAYDELNNLISVRRHKEAREALRTRIENLTSAAREVVGLLETESPMTQKALTRAFDFSDEEISEALKVLVSDKIVTKHENGSVVRYSLDREVKGLL